MANNLTKNPLVLDTTGSTDLATALTGRAGGRVKIGSVRWVGASASGHQAILTDADGTTIWESIANAANFVDESILPGQFYAQGLKLSTLGSGKLYVYMGEC